jgi:hypothetical protein
MIGERKTAKQLVTVVVSPNHDIISAESPPVSFSSRVTRAAV